ncbi:Uncharacterized protein T03_4448 [Trichinella britovi]|uniref:Zinc finger BED domain-containing protein 5 n=1 Tax=Trichinella britovi TaxID=45882 RepID=A0A0V1CRD7_TRIBR|nr:Uncharacterized protein T03_4448 [Trichinella britovi]
MCLIERSRRSLSRRAQYASALCRSLGMDEWLIRKPVKREVAEMESQKGSTAGDVNNKRKIDENESANFQLSNRRKVIRKYDIDYLKFEFTWNGDHKDPRPLCVICNEILANESMRPNKLLRHVETKHMDLKSKPLQFFESKLTVYTPLFPYVLRDEKFVLKLTYLVDICSKLNDLNLYLQGMDAADIFSVHDKIRGFMKKLYLWKKC